MYIAFQMITDMATVVSDIAIEGFLKRLHIRQPPMSKVLSYQTTPLITDQMNEDFNGIKQNYRGIFLFFSNNGFFRYKFMDYWNNKSKGVRYFPIYSGF
jgi:hypothetical protein